MRELAAPDLLEINKPKLLKAIDESKAAKVPTTEINKAAHRLADADKAQNRRAKATERLQVAA